MIDVEIDTDKHTDIDTQNDGSFEGVIFALNNEKTLI